MSTLWNAFAARADDNPALAALVFGDDATTFAELRALALRCAHVLATRGVGRGHVVVLQLPKRRITYALLLACLRLGAPYLCIDPKNPPERTRRILERVRPSILFSEGEGENPHGSFVRLVKDNGEAWLTPTPNKGTRFEPVTSADPAYLMFTSGSTGEPKGAVIPHQGVANLMAWARSWGAGPGQRFTGINPLHFDNSVFDFYCGLLNGATLIPIETGEMPNPATWVRLIRTSRVTVMFAVPTLFLILDQLGLLTPQSLPDVRMFLFGGEGYPTGKLRDFLTRFEGRARLVNVYGPTETSCICSSIEITPEVLVADSPFPPLGRMHENFSHLLLDDGLRPTPAGGVGELWIGGPCVGLGYFRNPGETAARFQQDPRQDRYRAIYYRSGDLVREDGAGLLWFHGRVDNQVKIRGHRIELEEIDHAVQRIPGVRRAVAVVVAATEGEEINVAFMADRAIGADEVRELCSRQLPAFMRPARFVQLAELPKNANGKVDRRAIQTLLQHPVSP